MAFTAQQLQVIGMVLVEEVNARDAVDPGTGSAWLGQFVVRPRVEQKTVIGAAIAARRTKVVENRANLTVAVATQEAAADATIAIFDGASTELAGV